MRDGLRGNGAVRRSSKLAAGRIEGLAGEIKFGGMMDFNNSACGISRFDRRNSLNIQSAIFNI